MIDASTQKELVARLHRIEGQIRGITRMVEEPRVCQDLLQQLAAAEAALRRVSGTILKYHVRRCVPESLGRSSVKQVQNLAELVDIFDRFSR